MQRITLNDHQVLFKPFDLNDIDRLCVYFQNLGTESINHFGPHPFTKEAIIEKYRDNQNYRQFIAVGEDKEIVAYSIVKMGWVDSDVDRLTAYGFKPEQYDCTFAPSVADGWQSKGIGSAFFRFIIKYLNSSCQIKRIILWGGVQSTNEKAIGFYKKFGFKKLGEFEHNGKILI